MTRGVDLVAAAARVCAVVREEERRARDAAAFPNARYPQESARWHRLQRQRRLHALAATLPAEGGER